MLSLVIKEPELKYFMRALMTESAFDDFEVRSLAVAHFVRIEIDGTLTRGETKQFAVWERLRPYILNFIKGKEKPAHIKIVFSMPREKLSEIIPNAAAAFLNMEYKDNEVRFTTATSQREFSLNKNQDAAWDDHIRAFLAEKGFKTETES